jgi:DNA-binding transcriptional ArsR family regulator
LPGGPIPPSSAGGCFFSVQLSSSRSHCFQLFTSSLVPLVQKVLNSGICAAITRRVSTPAPLPDSVSAADQAVEAMASYFCRVADTFSLPRSAALIYHALFTAERPLSFTEIVEGAGLSKGSASTGLRLLKRMRAIEIVFVSDSRSTYYRPELSLRRLAVGFLEESLMPGLVDGGHLLGQVPPHRDDELPPHLKQRLSSLRHWHETSRGLLPMLAALGEHDADP